MNATRSFVPLAACLLAGCGSYGPQSLAKGSGLDAATHAMGVPTADAPLPDGGRRLEYARGPFGKHTYMLDFDAKGQLTGWQQVLTEERFNTIRPGMESSEVVALIGHSFERRELGWQKQTVWAYRYETPFCQWFQVSIDARGKVIDSSYGPDPICDVGDITDH